MAGKWLISLDRGGTFTDFCAQDPIGGFRRHKCLSDDGAALRGVRALVGAAVGPLPPLELRVGTTVATNALLTRSGAPTGLLITRGFRDLLRIGEQDRPEIFALEGRRAPPLYRLACEVRERCDAAGRITTPLDQEDLILALDTLKAAGCRALAIVFLHSFRNDEHERRASAAARAAGFDPVIASSALCPVIHAVGRGETAVAEAYLLPVLSAYLDRLRADFPGTPIAVMQSSGDLADSAAVRAHATVLSGPAGGAVALKRYATRQGLARAIGLDMGGTSTDVCRVAGDLELEGERRIAGLQLRTPTLAIETVAAGGGSICALVDGRLTVGPQSAGADPGPACYGRGGPLTLTDLHLCLGRLEPERFPFPLDAAAATQRLSALADEVALATQRRPADDELARDLIAIADEVVARAIRRISVERGVDPAEHVLVAFGGAGGLHACGLAQRLGMQRVHLPAEAGIFSALGIQQADRATTRTTSILTALDDEHLGRLPRAAEGQERHLGLRYRGVQDPIEIPFPADGDAGALRAAYEEEHQRRFGFRHQERPVEIVTLRTTSLIERGYPRSGWGDHCADQELRSFPQQSRGGAVPAKRVGDLARTCAHGAPDLQRQILRGPRTLAQDHATAWLPEGWEARPLDDCQPRPRPAPWRGIETSCGGFDRGGWELRPTGAAPWHGRAIQKAAAIEIYHHRYMAIAEQMGADLRRLAVSTNMRERLDYSCAVFDGQARLIANAPHIPVHLGAMGATVAALRGRFGAAIAPGDAFLSNDPAEGGSHLPDLTLVLPVFADPAAAPAWRAAGAARPRGCERPRIHFAAAKGNCASPPWRGRERSSRSAQSCPPEPFWFVAARGHHADIGGPTPGSMPALSRCLADEGIVISGARLLHEGRWDEEALRRILSTGPHPARQLEERLADLRAQLAACRRGERLLLELLAERGPDELQVLQATILDHSAQALSAALSRWPPGTRESLGELDDGSRLHLRLELSGGRARFDFRGSAPAHGGNLNAPAAVTRAAVLYVLRCLVDRPIPLNDGFLRPVEILLSPHSILDPPPGAAVAGGNVETSQRIVDVCLAALGLAANAQGSMNNLSFGDGHFGYYETLGGGAGATPRSPGADGLHSHMTNTRLTDIEILESVYPVLVRAFTLRPHSGGTGERRGGHGLVRCLEFTQPLTLSILSERRRGRPQGLEGGGPGARGLNILWRAGQQGETLPGHHQCHVEPGDRLEILTPGGGGYGRPTSAHTGR